MTVIFSFHPQQILKIGEKSNNRTSTLFIGFAAIQDILEAFKRFELSASSGDVPESVFKQEEEEFIDPSELPEAEPDTVYVQDSYNPKRYFRLRLRKNRSGAFVDMMQVTLHDWAIQPWVQTSNKPYIITITEAFSRLHISFWQGKQGHGRH